MITEVNLENKRRKIGRVNKFFKVEDMGFSVDFSNKLENLNIIELDDSIAEGLLLFLNEGENQYMLYKTAAKRIIQKPIKSTHMKDNTFYSFWIPELYFFVRTYKKRVDSMYVTYDVEKYKFFPFSNLFSGTDSHSLQREYFKKFPDASRKICMGRSLENLGKCTPENIDQFIATLLSAQGNDDLNPTGAFEKVTREIHNSHSTENTYHKVFWGLTQMEKDIETEEQYLEFLNAHTLQKLSSNLSELYK